jgi:phosphoglycolate phosphatase-like HAD superfamily hydrolase
MMTDTPRILLFDIDGTLVASDQKVKILMRRALEDVFGTAGQVDAYEMSGKTDWQIVTDLMLEAGIEPAVIEASRSAIFAALTRHMEAAAPTLEMRMLPGVAKLLEHLAGQPDFILGLVTGNVREAVPAKLLAAGIDPALFRFGAFGSEHPDRNALPALALSRLEQALGREIPKEKALVIGDTPRDIECARFAGLKVLCVATGRYSREALVEYRPDYLLDDLTDTETVLDILSRY